MIKFFQTKRIPQPHYAIFLTGIFLLVGAFTAAHHEMWRDEIQAWLLARDSSSLIDLFRNLKYEGHPGLWHICLMPLSRITKSPVIMQVFHLLIAATTVYLFARYAPFNSLQKFLFAFGYFPLYEYAIVCRKYALGVLLICLFCILFQHRYTTFQIAGAELSRFLLIGAILFLLGHTSAHCLIITMVTGFALFLDHLFTRKGILATGQMDERQIWIGFGLIAFGIITSVLQLNPPSDTGFAVPWRWSYDADYLKDIIRIMTRAFFPIPEAKLHFWGSQWLGKYPVFTSIQLRLSYLLIIWSSLILLRKPTALLIYLGGTIGLLSFFYVKYFGGMRHHGFLFMLFIMAMWIYRYCAEVKYFMPINRLNGILGKSLSPVLTLILTIHLIGGITAVRMDRRHVFSYGKKTAEYIKAQSMQDMLMVGEVDYAVSTVVGYLEKDNIYYMRGNRLGSFVRWDNARTHDVSVDEIIQKTREIRDEHKQEVLMILNKALNKDQISGNALTELTNFTTSTIGDEGFYLYLMRED